MCDYYPGSQSREAGLVRLFIAYGLNKKKSSIEIFREIDIPVAD